MSLKTLEVKVGKMEVEVGKQGVMLKALHDRLVGGEGQKGVIQVHDEQIDELDQEIGGLKSWKDKATGAIAVVSFLVTALGIVRIIEAIWSLE
jgi:hypothetical protein